MCGIAGAFSTDATKQWQPTVDHVIQEQYPRGPDHQAVIGVPADRCSVVLGHNRLSIIDLSAAAHQPMWDVSRRYCLTYNGEVYNYLELREELRQLGHEFATNSDTEVLLEAFKAWGPAAVERFNGMFAFGLFDAQEERLWLFRDRFGVKPLYYHLTGHSLVFASKATALANALRLPPDLAYAARGLRYWVYEDEGVSSPYVGVSALPAGTCLELSVDSHGELRSEHRRYYDLAERVAALRDDLARKAPRDLVELTAHRLEKAVEVRLRADVPIGVSLSGGLDSSTVAALFSEQHDRVVGFTFGSPTQPDSEGPLVEELRRQTGIEVVYVWPDAASISELAWETLAAQDGPFPGGSVIAQYAVYKAARARGVIVLVGGQGGDEDFMGYRKYQLFRLRQLLGGKRHGQALQLALGLLPTLLAERRNWGIYWVSRHRYAKERGPESTLRLPDPEPLELGYDPSRPLWHRQLEDVTRFSLPTLLRYEDRNSMGNSVESRLPFMDYRVVELGLALPEAVKVRGGHGKWIVRQVSRSRIPKSIWGARGKRGFDVQEMTWVRNGLGAAIRGRVRESTAAVGEFLSPETTIDVAFSDARLTTSPTALYEALTLCWLGDCLR